MSFAARLSRPGSPVNAGDIHAQLMSGDPAKAAASFVQVMQLAAGQALEERRIGDQDARAPALLLAIDQAEELLASDDAEESQRALFTLTSEELRLEMGGADPRPKGSAPMPGVCGTVTKQF